MPDKEPRRPTRLSDLGEQALIERIAKRAGRSPGGRWTLGIGDDAALLRGRAGEELVFSTDTLVEDVHFRFGREGPRAIGRRAIAVNLSDLAAMGAAPVGVLLGLCAPAADAGRRLRRPDRGRRLRGAAIRLSARRREPVAGGRVQPRRDRDRTRRDRACAQAFGPRPGRSPLRDGRARSGGAASARGGSARGPAAPRPRAAPRGGPAPRASAPAKACIDLSDGLASDLGQLLRASRVARRDRRRVASRRSGFRREPAARSESIRSHCKRRAARTTSCSSPSRPGAWPTIRRPSRAGSACRSPGSGGSSPAGASAGLPVKPARHHF